MAGNRVKGAKQLAVELPAEFVDEFKEWVRERGEKIGPTVMLALRRHMAYPPADAVPPLPDGAAPGEAAPPPATKRGKK